MVAPAKKKSPDELLGEEIAFFYDDPLAYVLFAFPWDDPSSGIQVVKLSAKYRKRFPNSVYGPDDWACDFLEQWGADIRARKFDGQTAVDPIRFATASGHGIGKSVLVAWIIKFIMDTRPFSKITVTAGTADQLRTKTWAEVGKWHKLSVTKHWFDYTATRGHMMLKHKANPESWFCSAQTCKEENSEAFAGQHAANATSAYVVDEGSGVPDPIFQVMEGGLTDGEPMQFIFGNPTRNSGGFFERCEGKLKHRYHVRHIDSRSVAITNKNYFQTMLEDNGEDSDFFKVRCRGMFPSAGSLQFIGMAEVNAARNRLAIPDRSMPLIIGVDVARFGDDESVLYPRMGNDAKSFGFRSFRGLNGVQLANKIIAMIQEFQALGVTHYNVFIDDTGGYGGSPIDHLDFLGWQAVGINFGNAANDDTYRYRGDEMWGRLRDALRNNLAIAPDDELRDQLTQREFGYTLVGNRIHLEPKKDMKERGLPSPDRADALALTFAMDVAPIQIAGAASTIRVKSDYDPYAEA
jgi:hypothetical protein